MEEGNWVKIPIKKQIPSVEKVEKKPLEIIDLKALFFQKKYYLIVTL